MMDATIKPKYIELSEVDIIRHIDYLLLLARFLGTYNQARFKIQVEIDIERLYIALTNLHSED